MAGRVFDTADHGGLGSGTVVAVALALLLLGSGCPPQPRHRLDPIALDQSIAIVNDNLSLIKTGLAASGTVTGQFVDRRGNKHTLGFGMDGKLSVIPPWHLRFDVRELGQTQLLVGSNEEKFWLHARADDDTYRWGTHAASDPLADDPDLPLRADQMIEALGLNGLPVGDTEIALEGLAQRVETDEQQLLFVRHDADGKPLLYKEYWLERYDRRLIRRILFRDPLGRVRMDAKLDGYQPLSADGPLLPHHLRVEWPLEQGVLDVRINRWLTAAELSKNADAFVAPHQRGKKFRHVINVDRERGLRED